MGQIHGSGIGNWANTAQVTDNNELKTLSSDIGLVISQGKVVNHSFVHKFGRNPDIDTGGFEAIWNGGGDYTGFNATSPEKLEIFSSNATDTSGTGTGAFTVCLPRLLDGNYVHTGSEIIELNGTNSVYTTGSYIRSSRAIILTAGASGINVGEITIRQSGTTANIMAVMPATYNQTMIACDTIPSGTTGHLTSWYAGLSAKKTGISNVRLLIRPFGGVFNVKEEFAIATVGTSYIQRIFSDVPKNDLPEKSDIKIMADSNISDQGIAAGFDLILVDN